jgi:hypothetical protein
MGKCAQDRWDPEFGGFGVGARSRFSGTCNESCLGPNGHYPDTSIDAAMQERSYICLDGATTEQLSVVSECCDVRFSKNFKVK